MKRQKKRVDHRQDSRFRVNDHVLAVFNSTVQFHIIDISNNGLSFRYIGKEKWFDGPTELNISYRNNFHLNKIPVLSISDFTFINNLIPMRRHSVKFGKLKLHQKTQLYQLIQYYTKGSQDLLT